MKARRGTPEDFQGVADGNAPRSRMRDLLQLRRA